MNFDAKNDACRQKEICDKQTCHNLTSDLHAYYNISNFICQAFLRGFLKIFLSIYDFSNGSALRCFVKRAVVAVVSQQICNTRIAAVRSRTRFVYEKHSPNLARVSVVWLFYPITLLIFLRTEWAAINIRAVN